MGTSQSAAQAASSLAGGPGVGASPGPPDAITSALAGMTRKQLYDIMAQMKGLIVQNPAQVTSTLGYRIQAYTTGLILIPGIVPCRTWNVVSP